MFYLNVDRERVDPKRKMGLKTLCSILLLLFSAKTGRYTVAFEGNSDSPVVTVEGSSVTIRYSRPVHAFRRLGILHGPTQTQQTA